jgi:hypothetical protein
MQFTDGLEQEFEVYRTRIQYDEDRLRMLGLTRTDFPNIRASACCCRKSHELLWLLHIFHLAKSRSTIGGIDFPQKYQPIIGITLR